MRFRVVLLLALIALPSIALAASTNFWGAVVPSCTTAEGELKICQACDLVSLAENILRIFVSFSVVAAALVFAYAGFLYVTAAANSSNIDSARKVFAGTLLGLIFVLCAYLIIDLMMRALTGQSLNIFTKVDCVKVTHTRGGVQYSRTQRTNPIDDTVTGEQGTAEIAQCPAGTGITHQNALNQLKAAGVTVTSTSGSSGVRDGCSGVGCTTLAGICDGTVKSMAALAQDNPCGGLTIWGAAEGGNAHGVNSWHGKGCAFDVSPNSGDFACLGNWLNQNSSKYGITEICTTPQYSQYRKNCGYNEGTDHFHLTFCNAN